jgi:hypothetical protein
MGCRYLIKFEWQCANFQCGTQEQNQMMTQTKTIRLNVEAVDALQELSRALFHKKLGREPGPDDPLVFDPDAETPQRMSQEKHQQQLAEKLN